MAWLLSHSAVLTLAQAERQRGRPWNEETFHLIQVTEQVLMNFNFPAELVEVLDISNTSRAELFR